MSRLFLFVLAFLIFSCKTEEQTSLQVNITSRNKDTFVELKALYLTNLTDPAQSVSFLNAKCIAPNKFIFTNLYAGTYKAVVYIDNGARCYIDLGTISLQQGENKVNPEINLGTIKL